MTEDKIRATILGVMDYKLTLKRLPLISACCIESQRSSFIHNPIDQRNDSIQYSMPTSQATISNPFDME